MTWGPFRPGLAADERKARLRALRVATALCSGPRASDVLPLLKTAETDSTRLDAAAAAFGRLPTLDQRRILSAISRVS